MSAREKDTKLSKSEQVLIHLYHNKFYTLENVVDREITADAMIEKLNISRSFLSESLSYWKKKEFIIERYCHAKGSPKRRVKAYALTSDGVRYARRLGMTEKEKDDLVRRRATAFWNLGMADWKSELIDEALDWYRKGLDATEGKHPEITGAIYIDMGNAYDERGDSEDAIECYKKAITLLTPIEKMRGELCRLYNNLAFTYQNMGKFTTALKHYQKSLYMDPTNAVEVAHSQAGQAHCYALLGEPDKAEKLIRLCAEYFEREDDKNMIGGIYWVHGLIHRCRGEYGLALEWMEKAHKLVLSLQLTFNARLIEKDIEQTKKDMV